MKRFVAFIALIAFFISCEKRSSNQDNTIDDEYVNISFAPVDVEVSESPLCSTRSGNNDDLYGLQILTDSGAPEVTWVTDDLSKSSVFLKKNRKYFCCLIYIPNGKNIIYQYGDSYGPPFHTIGSELSPKFDVIHYGAGYAMLMARYGGSQTKDKNNNMIQTNFWNQVDIYYGIKEIDTTKDEEVQVDLYRMMFGLTINTTNFTKGKLVVYSCSANQSYQATVDNDGYIYTLTPTTPNLDVQLELVRMPFELYYGPASAYQNLISQLKTWKCDDTIAIDYINDTGRLTTLVKKSLKTERMKRYTIDIDVEELLDEIEGSIKGNVVDDEWSKESLTLGE